MRRQNSKHKVIALFMESHATNHSSRAKCSVTCIHLTVTATSQLIFHFSTLSTIINKFSQRALPFEINFRPQELERRRFSGSSIFRFEKFAIISWLVVYLPRCHASVRERDRQTERESKRDIDHINIRNASCCCYLPLSPLHTNISERH